MSNDQGLSITSWQATALLAVALVVFAATISLASFAAGIEEGLERCRAVFTNGKSHVAGFRTNAKVEVDNGAELWFGPAYLNFDGEVETIACRRIRVLRAIAGNPVVTCERIPEAE